jgi:hypothetical protein
MVNQILEPVLKTWPATLQEEFRAYQVDRRKSPSGFPLWLALPEAICKGGNLEPPETRGKTAELILRGQLCLFLGIRILDDLLDGQSLGGRLALLSDLFLVEGERSLELTPRLSHAFHGVYKQAVRDTLMGIVQVDELQRDLHSGEQALLESYAQVDSIFSVGTEAALDVTGRQADIPESKRFYHEVGKASQILDDLYDMAEDLASGRINVPVRLALAGASVTPESLEEVLGVYEDLLDEAWVEAVGKVAERCLDRAEAALAVLKVTPEHDYVAGYRTSIRDALASRGKIEPEPAGAWEG